MTNKKNLILIDENNFFFKCFWNQALSVQGQRIEIVYAIFKNLNYVISNIRKETGINDDTVILCGDMGYSKRMEISKKAVNDRIIKSTYKSDRRISNHLKKMVISEEEVAEIENRYDQLAIYEEIIKMTRFQRVSIGGEEADDVIASYCTKYKDEYNCIIISSDNDYLQLLDDNVMIYNSHKSIFLYKDTFIKDWGFEPKYFVDYGAILGDKSDTIIGVNGLGPVKTKPFIIKYKTIENMLAELKDMNIELYNEMKKYKHFDEFRVNVKQTTWTLLEAKILFHEGLLMVAKSLKKMFCNLDIPQPVNKITEEQVLEWKFKDLNFVSLIRHTGMFTYNATKDKVSRIIKMKNKPFITYKCKKCEKEFLTTKEDDILDVCNDCGGDLIKKPQNFIEQTKFF